MVKFFFVIFSKYPKGPPFGWLKNFGQKLWFQQFSHTHWSPTKWFMQKKFDLHSAISLVPVFSETPCTHSCSLQFPNLLAAVRPGQEMYSALCSPTPGHLANVSTSRGRLPPTLFIRNRNVPILTDLILAGTISTKTVNNSENQVSAKIKF